MDKNIIAKDKDFALFVNASLDTHIIPESSRIEKDKDLNLFGFDGESMSLWVGKYLSKKNIYSPSQFFIIDINNNVDKKHRAKFWNEELKTLSKKIHKQTLRPRVILKSVDSWKNNNNKKSINNIEEKHIHTLNHIEALEKLWDKYRGDTEYLPEDLEPALNAVKTTINHMVEQEVDENTEELKNDLIDGMFKKLEEYLPKKIVIELYRYAYFKRVNFAKQQLLKIWPVTSIHINGNNDFMNATHLLIVATNNKNKDEESTELLLKIFKLIFDELLSTYCDQKIINKKNELVNMFYKNICNEIPHEYIQNIFNYIQSKKIQGINITDNKTNKSPLSIITDLLNKKTDEEKLFESNLLEFKKINNIS